jgi:hypothetical protein
MSHFDPPGQVRTSLPADRRADGSAVGIVFLAPGSADTIPTPKHASERYATAHQPDVRVASDDWTTAAPTQALFVVLTVIAVPWFIARLRRRLGRHTSAGKAAAGRAIGAPDQPAGT